MTLRTLARLTADLPPTHARRILSALAAHDDAPLEERIEQRAVAAFESDMQPVCSAVVAALKSGTEAVWHGLRAMLPHLLAQVNETSSLAGVLKELMLAAALAGLSFDEAVAVRAADFTEDPAVTHAIEQWRSRGHLPTELSSFDMRSFSAELRMRSIFSARMTNADAVAELARTIDDMLSGKIGLGEGRYRMMRTLKELGYDPEKGFPQDMANVPPAERGSLRDLSSERRLNLMLETNQRVAANYGRFVAGNDDYARHAYPAWELVRLYHRDVPRGTPDSHSPGWSRRWHDAAESVDWEGVSRAAFADGRFIALKDSPIWLALGEGEGGYTDTLGNPFPPFAFNTGFGWRAVPRAECEAIALITGDHTPAAQHAPLSPGAKEVNAAFARMPADLQDELRRELLAA